MARAFSPSAILTILIASMAAVGMAQQQQQRQRQVDPTTCLGQLVECLHYLNSTSHNNPPKSCCNPLKSVIKSSPECLCAMISTRVTDQARQAGINIDRASDLPGRCGQHVNPLACLKTAGSSSNSASNSATASLAANWVVLFSLGIALSRALWPSS